MNDNKRAIPRSRWLADKSGYVTPDKTIVRIWNGHMLYIARNGEQQRAQAEIGERKRHDTTRAP